MITDTIDMKSITGDNPTSVKSEWIHCNTCGADAFQELSTVDGWHIGKCRQCSQIYLNPMPFFEPSLEFSNMSLDFEYTRFQHEVTDTVLSHDRRQFDRHLEHIAALTGNRPDKGRFLDIGCGSGASLRAAVDAGWEAIGIDIDPVLIETAKRQLQVDARCSALLDSDLDADQFDFIRLRDVIEHLPNPYDVLVEIKRLLVPGGVVLIATPNEAALPTQMRLLAGFKRSKIATVTPPHHVHGFTPDTLDRIVKRAGFNVLNIFTTTPVDPNYVTARNMQSENNALAVAVWKTANFLGKGSMLIGWIGKEP